MEGEHGEGNDERGSLAGAEAGGADGSAVAFDEVLDDGEAEAEAAVFTRGGGVGLAEAVEDVGEEVGVDAFAGVGDAGVRSGN